MERLPMTPRELTQTGFYLSFATSGAFNVLGSMLATSNPVAWAVSALWSAFAFIAIEIMVKVKYPARKRNAKRNPWNIVRFGGVGFVALIAMVISYGHTFDVMQSWNQGVLASLVAPLCVDGFLALTSLTLMVLPAPRKLSKPATKPVRKLKVA